MKAVKESQRHPIVHALFVRPVYFSQNRYLKTLISIYRFHVQIVRYILI
jgi:hypothetical protein